MLPEFHQSSELYQSTNQLHQVNRQSGIRQDDIKDPITARKVLKADREKLRRDRLNEQFSELGSALDPDRPKNALTDYWYNLQDANSNVKQGNSSMCSTGGVSADLKSVQKAVIRGSSPSQSVQDAASSSFGDDCSTKSSRNSTKEKK